MKKGFIDKEGPNKAKPSPPPWVDQLDVATRQKLRDEGKCFYCERHWEPRHHYLEKDQVHYIEVLSEGGSDDSNLDLGSNTLDQGLLKVEGTLNIMIASLHGVKKYLM